ncbi:MAG: Mur ligase family protein [Thermodesulfovibrionales bacterium]
MPKRIFFSGIAGSGTSALAFFYAKKGFLVSGSDRLFDKNPDHSLLNVFRNNNIMIFPQDGSGIEAETDTFVFSTAVEDNNPDILKAKRLGIKMMTRPEFLSQMVKQYKTVAIAGTSGKSTTSSMLAFLMYELGLKPNFIGGGRMRHSKTHPQDEKCNITTNYLIGDSDILIIEACESDGSIVNYFPESTILLNLDLDHHKIEDTKRMFERLIENTDGKVLYNADDKNLNFVESYPRSRRFALMQSSDYTPRDMVFEGFGSRFRIRDVEFKISLPGRHNLINALACITYLSDAGIDLRSIAGVIHKFSGVERRFDIYLDDHRGFVVDDYAHNPHKISFLMETISMLKDRVCYVFQPHGYGPTRLMKDGYIETFCKHLRNEDILLILPIYYAGGSASKDISSKDLSDAISKTGKVARSLTSREEVLNMSQTYKNFVVFGARDDTLADLAKAIRDNLIGH